MTAPIENRLPASAIRLPEGLDSSRVEHVIEAIEAREYTQSSLYYLVRHWCHHGKRGGYKGADSRANIADQCQLIIAADRAGYDVRGWLELTEWWQRYRAYLTDEELLEWISTIDSDKSAGAHRARYDARQNSPRLKALFDAAAISPAAFEPELEKAFLNWSASRAGDLAVALATRLDREHGSDLGRRYKLEGVTNLAALTPAEFSGSHKRTTRAMAVNRAHSAAGALAIAMRENDVDVVREMLSKSRPHRQHVADYGVACKALGFPPMETLVTYELPPPSASVSDAAIGRWVAASMPEDLADVSRGILRNILARTRVQARSRDASRLPAKPEPVIVYVEVPVYIEVPAKTDKPAKLASKPAKLASRPAAPRPLPSLTDAELLARALDRGEDVDDVWREARRRKWNRKKMIEAFED